MLLRFNSGKADEDESEEMPAMHVASAANLVADRHVIHSDPLTRS